jgi:hypothetical protein
MTNQSDDARTTFWQPKGQTPLRLFPNLPARQITIYGLKSPISLPRSSVTESCDVLPPVKRVELFMSFNNNDQINAQQNAMNLRRKATEDQPGPTFRNFARTVRRRPQPIDWEILFWMVAVAAAGALVMWRF